MGQIHPPKGLLLVGVPGTGKTLAARAIAAAWNLPLVRLDTGRLYGSLVGESESNLRQAIRTAEAIAPCVVLVDEIEKAFGQGGGHDGGTSQRVFGALLTWLSDKRAECFVVATANEIGALPPELLRKGRFDEIFAVDLPDVAARAEILRIHLERAGHRLKQAELADLGGACAHYTGAELESAIQSALIEAFHNRERQVNATDVLKAIRPPYRSLEPWPRRSMRYGNGVEAVALCRQARPSKPTRRAGRSRSTYEGTRYPTPRSPAPHGRAARIPGGPHESHRNRKGQA